MVLDVRREPELCQQQHLSLCCPGGDPVPLVLIINWQLTFNSRRGFSLYFDVVLHDFVGQDEANGGPGDDESSSRICLKRKGVFENASLYGNMHALNVYKS